MTEFVCKMEDIKVELMGARSVAMFLGEFFEPIDPDPAHLARYPNYADLSAVLFWLICDAEKNIDKLTDEMHKSVAHKA
jgi:hypothetical protein